MRCKLVALSFSLFTLAQAALAHDEQQSIRLIIKYQNPSLSALTIKNKISQSTHLAVEQLAPMANGAYSLTLKSAVGSHLKNNNVLDLLHQDPMVRYAVTDRVGYFKPVPEPKVDEQLNNVLSHESQWDEFSRPAGVMLESKPGLKDGAWAYTTGKAKNPVVVAVLDTGIALNDSLVNNLLKDQQGAVWGWNFAGNNNNLDDETGSYHGTHVSGTIAGYGDVMTGMGEELKVLTVKIPQADGMFYESAVINGIYWSVGAEVPGVPTNNYPAKVLNMSFGVDLDPDREIDYCDEALQEAVFYARKQGAVLAVAAGNDNRWEHFNAPAVCNGAMKIASTGPEGLRSYFSNYGPSVTLAAPGGDKRYGLSGAILSTVNPGGGYQGSGFDFYQGTSMATPHVAGVAGLVYAVSGKSLTAEKVEQILYITTHDFGASTDSNKSCKGKKPCGHGILDAEEAVKTALADYDVLFTAPKADEAKKACAAANIKTIKSGSVTWLKIQDSCQNPATYQQPVVQQNNEGIITAHYGAAAHYQLNQSPYKECHVVGHDGIGCYF
jgi:serine protease